MCLERFLVYYTPPFTPPQWFMGYKHHSSGEHTTFPNGKTSKHFSHPVYSLIAPHLGFIIDHCANFYHLEASAHTESAISTFRDTLSIYRHRSYNRLSPLLYTFNYRPKGYTMSTEKSQFTYKSHRTANPLLGLQQANLLEASTPY